VLPPSDTPARYFAASAAVLFASASRSVFLRRVARFFTLSLPLQCPIDADKKHASPACAKLYRRDLVKKSAFNAKSGSKLTIETAAKMRKKRKNRELGQQNTGSEVYPMGELGPRRPIAACLLFCTWSGLSCFPVLG